MDSLPELVQVIKNLENVYILTHMYPDGDALGSAFALCRILQKLGKKATVMLGSCKSNKLNFFRDYIQEQTFEPEYIVSVDLAANSLLDPALEKYAEKIDICIDHHQSNRGYAALNYIDSSAAACCEIIYEVVSKLNVPMDKKIAEGLYIGISSDTGCFRYSNTTYKSHLIASKLIKQGIRVAEINEKFFTLKSRKQLKLEKVLYDNLEYFFDDKVAITSVSKAEMAKCEIEDDECEGIASIPIKVEGVGIGVTLREKQPGNYKVSIRTSAEYDANKLATLFGGGGHLRASGFDISGSLKEVKETIIKTLSTELGG